MLTCWLGGVTGSPSVCVNLNEPGTAVITGALLTINVTGTEYGLLPAPEDVSVTVPVYVPAISPVGLTATETSSGVLPEPVAESQAPEDVLAAAVTEGLPVSLVTDSVWFAGVAPPIWKAKLMLVGEVDKFGSVDTANVDTSGAPGIVTASLVLRLK